MFSASSKFFPFSLHSKLFWLDLPISPRFHIEYQKKNNFRCFANSIRFSTTSFTMANFSSGQWKNFTNNKQLNFFRNDFWTIIQLCIESWIFWKKLIICTAFSFLKNKQTYGFLTILLSCFPNWLWSNKLARFAVFFLNFCWFDRPLKFSTRHAASYNKKTLSSRQLPILERQC